MLRNKIYEFVMGNISGMMFLIDLSLAIYSLHNY